MSQKGRDASGTHGLAELSLSSTAAVLAEVIGSSGAAEQGFVGCFAGGELFVGSL